MAFSLVNSLWPTPNPSGLDRLPEAHTDKFTGVFNQAIFALQGLSGVSDLPDELRVHDTIDRCYRSIIIRSRGSSRATDEHVGRPELLMHCSAVSDTFVRGYRQNWTEQVQSQVLQHSVSEHFLKKNTLTNQHGCTWRSASHRNAMLVFPSVTLKNSSNLSTYKQNRSLGASVCRRAPAKRTSETPSTKDLLRTLELDLGFRAIVISICSSNRPRKNAHAATPGTDISPVD